MKLKKLATTLAAITLGSVMSIANAALPNSIVFDNLTDIQLDAYTAGQAGASIERNSTNFAVPFIGVMARCNMGGTPSKCPIEFYDHDTGNFVASVYLNIWDASVVGTPTISPDYAQFEISGWESTPVSKITILQRS